MSDDLVAQLAEQGGVPLPPFPVRTADVPGPNVLYQVVFASTLYGRVARCGCGWKAVHKSESAASASGRRHAWAAHGAVQPVVVDEPEGAA